MKKELRMKKKKRKKKKRKKKKKKKKKKKQRKEDKNQREGFNFIFIAVILPMPFRSDEGGRGISGAGSSGISLSRFWTPTMSVEMVEDADDDESFTPPVET